MTLGARRIEARQREQLVALERHAGGVRKRERRRLRRGRFIQRRLRAEQQLDEKLRTRCTEPRVAQHVDRVMAGVRLVAREIERAIYRERQRGVDAHTADESPLVARERAPRQLAHVVDLHALAGRQRDVRARRGATALDGPREDRRKPIRRDQKLPIECRVPRGEIAATGQHAIQLRANLPDVHLLPFLPFPPLLPIEPKQQPHLVVKLRTRTLQDVDACRQCLQLPAQEVAPDVIRSAQPLGERRRSGPDVGQGGVPRARLGKPGDGTVVVVERIGIALAERERQADVRLGGRVDRDRRGIAARSTAAHAGDAGGQRRCQHNSHRLRLSPRGRSPERLALRPRQRQQRDTKVAVGEVPS